MAITLRPQPLTRERFAPFGDVIESASARRAAMNAGRFDRFDDLGSVDVCDEGIATISIARCREATTLPYRIDVVERHPRGSQAFIPLTPGRLIVVVAPPQDRITAADLSAFVTNGRQGINYHRGTWHMPLIAFAVGQEFLIVDRGDDAANCDEQSLDQPVILVSE